MMKALVLKEYGRLVIEEVPKPVLQPDEVLVRVRACGICGSDVHGMDGSTGRRIPPLIMGHEASGEIAETGPQVRGWKPGDRVTFDSTVYCGKCWHCRRGEINLCDDRRVLGVSCAEYRRHGAFAEFVAVPERILYRLPDSLAFEQAALVEAVSVAVHAVERAPLPVNASVAVVGAGMIGLLVIQVLRIKGCGAIIAIDVDGGRLELARRLGATAAVPAGSPGVAEAVRRLSHGRGSPPKPTGQPLRPRICVGYGHRARVLFLSLRWAKGRVNRRRPKGTAMVNTEGRISGGRIGRSALPAEEQPACLPAPRTAIHRNSASTPNNAVE